MKFKIAFLAIPLLAIACQKPEVPLTLEINVTDSQGAPLEAAQVSLDKQLLGQSDKAGKIVASFDATVGDSYRLEVTKESRSYYFAPFYQNVGTDVELAETIKINAVLFFVPKPEGSDAEKKTLSTAVDTVEEEAEALEQVEEVEQDLHEETAEELVSSTKEVSKQEEVVDSQPVMPASPVKTKAEVSIFTVHVYSGTKPVPGAEVFVGDRRLGNLKKGCVSNARGRCALQFSSVDGEESAKTFVAKKAGFQTVTAHSEVSHRGKIRMQMKRGTSLDFFALSNTYGYTRGIAGVDIHVKGVRVGETDEFGHFDYAFVGKKEDLVDITMRPDGLIPEEYQTDLVVAGPVTIIKHFTPAIPPSVRVAVMKVQPAGRVGKDQLKYFSQDFNDNIQTKLRSDLFKSPSFKMVSLERFQKAAVVSGRSLSEMIKKGWRDTPIKGVVDAIVVPTVVMGKRVSIELSAIDSRGRVLTAARETLDSISDESAVDQAIKQIAHSLSMHFPFEGAVLGRDDELVRVNLGVQNDRYVNAGDVMDVFGVQKGAYGASQKYSKVATMEVVQVEGKESRCRIIELTPRSTVDVGDLVVVRPSPSHESSLKSPYVQVVSTEGGSSRPIPQANLYFNKNWLGATDRAGKFYLSETVSGSGQLRVVKSGYEEFSKEMSFDSKKAVEIRMERQTAFLVLDSLPSGAEVLVEGKVVGVTPLSVPAPVSAGFVKLEIRGPEGYKDFMQVLDLQSGTIDLTGARAIQLERELQSTAQRLVKAGKLMEAVKSLKSIPKSHSDYLQANHLLGEIYLTKLGEPRLAAKAFASVTASPEVRNYNDKRFIGSHINEAVANFKQAEQMNQVDQEAAQMYLKTAEKLEDVASHLRFVESNQFAVAATTVAYYKALSFHKLWYQTGNKLYLNKAYKGWQEALDQIEDKKKVSEIKSFYDDAVVYFKQAQREVEGKKLVR